MGVRAPGGGGVRTLTRVSEPRPEDTDSAELLRAARGGSAAAMGTLFRRCGPKLRALIRLRLGPQLRRQADSEDILQVTLLRGMQRLDQFEGRDGGALMGWLAAIARNEIKDLAAFHGRQKRDARLAVPLDDGLEVAAEQIRTEVSRIAWLERSRRLEESLRALSDEHREVILLRQIEELSFAEVGRAMDRSPDAARMLFARAMAALSVQMRRELDEGSSEV